MGITITEQINGSTWVLREWSIYWISLFVSVQTRCESENAVQLCSFFLNSKRKFKQIVCIFAPQNSANSVTKPSSGRYSICLVSYDIFLNIVDISSLLNWLIAFDATDIELLWSRKVKMSQLQSKVFCRMLCFAINSHNMHYFRNLPLMVVISTYVSVFDTPQSLFSFLLIFFL